MSRKKKEQAPPLTPVRPIECAFCQKELNPLTDEVTFIGVGKWRDGPGLFHAVCSAKTPDNEENPCFKNGMAWATKIVKKEPVCMTFEQWKARPTRRNVAATRAAGGRYELRLTESHLNCVYFLETKHAANAEKAKEVVRRWQTDWGLSPDDVPDIDQSEREARQAEDAQRIMRPTVAKVEMPEELSRELQRHFDTHLDHLRANPTAGGDDCESCRISRGMKKLYAIRIWLPVIQQSLETMKMVKESSAPIGRLMKDCQKISDDAMKSLYDELDLKPKDEQHNESASKRSAEEMRLAKELVEKYDGKS
jgi:hypothetical protein